MVLPQVLKTLILLHEGGQAVLNLWETGKPRAQ